jgi:hypothetical protein
MWAPTVLQAAPRVQVNSVLLDHSAQEVCQRRLLVWPTLGSTALRGVRLLPVHFAQLVLSAPVVALFPPLVWPPRGITVLLAQSRLLAQTAQPLTSAQVVRQHLSPATPPLRVHTAPPAPLLRLAPCAPQARRARVALPNRSRAPQSQESTARRARPMVRV